MRRSATVLATALVSLGVTSGLSPVVVGEQSPMCGSYIFFSTVLSSDMGPCPGNALFIGSDNITLDCAGHVITGSYNAAPGIIVDGHSGVTIKNCRVYEFAFAVDLYGSGNTIEYNLAVNGSEGGILVIGSGNTVLGNMVLGNSTSPEGPGTTGIYDYLGSENSIISNYVSGFVYGYQFGDASGDDVEMNVAFGNNVGFFLWGTNSSLFLENSGVSNGNAFEVADGLGNTFVGNSAEHNWAWGFIDFSVGQGTAGTGDSYLGNRCVDDVVMSHPVGMCSIGPTVF